MGAEGSRLYSPSDESTGYLSSPQTPSPNSPNGSNRTLATVTTVDVPFNTTGKEASRMIMVSSLRM